MAQSLSFSFSVSQALSASSWRDAAGGFGFDVETAAAALQKLSFSRSTVNPLRSGVGPPSDRHYFAFAGGALVALVLKAERKNQ